MMTDAEYQKATIEAALAGDASAGVEALRLCREGLDSNRMSAELRSYLAERITELIDGVRPDKALRIAKKVGKPKDPFPEWQQHLGALAALLSQRGYRPKQIALALCDQRAAVHDKSLEEPDAHAIRSAWRPMQRLDVELLMHLAGPYREILSEYPPLK